MSFILYDREPNLNVPTDPKALQMYNATAFLSAGWTVALVGPRLAVSTVHQGGVGVGQQLYLSDGSTRTIKTIQLSASNNDFAYMLLDQDVPTWFSLLPEALRHYLPSRSWVVGTAQGWMKGPPIVKDGKLRGWEQVPPTKEAWGRPWAEVDPAQAIRYNDLWTYITAFQPKPNSLALAGNSSSSTYWSEVNGQIYYVGTMKAFALQFSIGDGRLPYPNIPVLFDGEWFGGKGYSYGSALIRPFDKEYQAIIRSTLLGDFNNDGSTNFEDLMILSKNYNRPGDHSHGDANGDGLVDFADLLIVSKEMNK